MGRVNTTLKLGSQLLSRQPFKIFGGDFKEKPANIAKLIAVFDLMIGQKLFAAISTQGILSGAVHTIHFGLHLQKT